MSLVVKPLTRTLSLDRDGAQCFPAALDVAGLDALRTVLSGQPADQAGIRLYRLPGLSPLVDADGPLGEIAAAMMGATPRPVRAILFDKSVGANWSLGWHQDRVIAVRERIDVAGFGPWTRKHGALHVAPPLDVFAKMVTLRLHLDAVPEGNAPLLIAPGSHRCGRIAEHDVGPTVERCGVFACLAKAGDAWLYATPILHASQAAQQPTHRRVLQVDYAVDDLSGGLEWLGV